MDKIVFCRC